MSAEDRPARGYVEPMIGRLVDEFAQADGRHADPEHVRELVERKAEELGGAPVQIYVPLLVEHHAVAELHEDGLHRRFETSGRPLQA
jgi:hypothetical protein